MTGENLSSLGENFLIANLSNIKFTRTLLGWNQGVSHQVLMIQKTRFSYRRERERETARERDRQTDRQRER